MRVLVADDDKDLAGAVSAGLREMGGYQVATVTRGGLEVLRQVQVFQPDVILMDVRMPCYNGATVCHHVLSRYPQIQVVLCSGTYGPDHPTVTGSGAAAFLSKPFLLAEVKEILERLRGHRPQAARFLVGAAVQ